jgi:hypothetical protein
LRRLALPLRGPVVGLLAVGVLVGAGCSSSSDSKGDSTTTTVPEDVLVSDAQVASGLAKLGTIAAGAAGEVAADSPEAKSIGDRAENEWKQIEGRIKKNDTSAYLEFEDALSDLRTGASDGDTAKVRRGAAAIALGITSYLKRYPG